MNFELLFSFFLVSFGLTISPGPDMLFVMSQSIASGRSTGVMISLGLVSGIIVHVTLVAFGFSAFIQYSPILLFILKLIGALYLLYLAYQTFRQSKLFPSELPLSTENSTFKLYWTGLLMNVLNPKVLLFFVAFFPAFIPKDLIETTSWIYLLGAIFMFQALMVFVTIAYVSNFLRTRLQSSDGIWFKGIQIFQTVLFVGLAVYLLFGDLWYYGLSLLFKGF